MTATRCRRVRTARSRRVGSRKRTQAPDLQSLSPCGEGWEGVSSVGGSARGGNPLDSRGRYPQSAYKTNLCATKPMVEALSFPLFRPFKGCLKHFVNRIGQEVREFSSREA